jgi:hypothetical protein
LWFLYLTIGGFYLGMKKIAMPEERRKDHDERDSTAWLAVLGKLILKHQGIQ